MEIEGIRFKIDSRAAKKGAQEIDKSLDKVSRSAKSTERQIGRSTKKIESSFKRMVRSAVSLKGALTAGAGFLVVRSIIRAASEYQNLAVRLETVTGSATKAAKAFGEIKEFAKVTPFQVDGITDAFIRLKAVGIEPTQELLTSFGDTAAAFGKDITQIAQAAIGAATGEFEMLKGFGIIAKVEKDKIRFIFKGTETLVGRSADEIIGHLRRIGQENFAGSMERQSKTLTGVLSTFEDSLKDLGAALGTHLLPALTDIVIKLNEAVKVLKESDIVPNMIKALNFVRLLDPVNLAIHATGDRGPEGARPKATKFDELDPRVQSLFGDEDPRSIFAPGSRGEELGFSARGFIGPALPPSSGTSDGPDSGGLGPTGAIEGFIGPMEKVIKLQEENIKLSENQKKAVLGFGGALVDSTQQGIASLIDFTGRSKIAFDDWALSLVSKIANVIAEMAALRLISAALGGIFGGGSGVSGFFNSAFGVGTASTVPTVGAQAVRGVGSARGGSMMFSGPSSGFIAPVKLHGTERVDVSPGGRVSSGGVTVIVEQTNNIVATDFQSFDARFKQSAHSNAEDLGNIVSNEIRRRG